MAVDEGEGSAHTPRMRLTAVARQEVLKGDQKAVAKAAGIDPSRLSRFLNGYASLGLDDLRRLEEALGLTHGHLLRRAGYVDDPQTVRAAIERDPDLTPENRAAVLKLYDALRSTSSAGTAKTAPTPANSPRR